MAQYLCLKSTGGIFISAMPDVCDVFNVKVKLDSVLHAAFKQARNAAIHRKFFSLPNSGLQYWRPAGGVIYKSVLHILWNFIHFHIFPLRQVAGNVAAQLLIMQYEKSFLRKQVFSGACASRIQESVKGVI